MGEILKNIGSKAKNIIIKAAVSVLPVVIIIGGIAMGLADSGGTSTAYADGASYSDYVNLGDYIVKTDEEGAMPALTKSQMETAIKSCYSGQAQTNMLSVINDLMSVQSNDKVNAAFMVAITQVESSGGTAWDAIDASTHNWMSVSWGEQWNGDSGKTYTTHHVWCCYDSFNEAIRKFGVYMTQSAYYFQNNRINVDDISVPYCDSNWATSVKKELDKMYSAVAETLPTNESASPEEGDGYSIVYTNGNKNYKLYEQWKGSYSTNLYGSTTISSYGCGPTSVAIVLSGLGINKGPGNVVFDCTSITNANGIGTLNAVQGYVEHYGLNCERFSYGGNSDKEKIRKHLQSGNPVILLITYKVKLKDGTQYNYSAGHYITLLSIDSNDNVYVGDPGSYTTDGYSTLDIILDQCSTQNYFLVSK